MQPSFSERSFGGNPPSLTVSQINRYIQESMSADPILRDIWIEGEISNLSRPSSGHLYLNLRDAQSSLKAVMWKSSVQRLRYQPQNGELVEAHGSISVYERDGIYQLYIDTLRPVGEGRLYQEFLRLKALLEAEGLFDSERKRPLPLFPQRIGVVTSPTGAAIQDIFNTLNRRFPLVEVYFAPAAVQGVQAPAEITAALARLYGLQPPLDLILLARGGGSLEDLQAFNEEGVVRTVAASPVPLITGIGHETDFTLADFAADLRAPTPTAAAEQAVPDRAELSLQLQAQRDRLQDAMERNLADLRAENDAFSTRFARFSPLRRINDSRQALDNLSMRLDRSNTFHVRSLRGQLQVLTSRLSALDPSTIFARGYAAVRLADGTPLKTIQAVQPGQSLRVILQDGGLSASVTEIWKKESL